MLAFNIQSRSSSPSSRPPGPPWTGLKSRGRHSTPSSALLAASSLCISSILVFSSVASSWFLLITAWAVLYQSFWDSRSSCSSSGRASGGVCRALAALKRRSFLPVYRKSALLPGSVVQLTFKSLMIISPLHIPEISNNESPVLSFLMIPLIAL